jgi:Protein of unknown function (DUF3237)
MTKLLRSFLAFSVGILGAGAGRVYGEKPEPPKLEHAFDLHLELGKATDVGKAGPAGLRRVVPVMGGTLEGPGLKGKIMPGADYQIIHADLLTEIDAHYVVQLESGELLYIVNRGVRHGPMEVLQKLAAGEKVDQSLIYFRTVVSVETAVPALDWMNRTIFVTRGERLPNEALIHVYRVK